MNWRYLGTLDDARQSGCSGVYLIVHRGIYNRIVYVGVSNNVGRRISEHYDGYNRGNRTVYNVSSNEDVYSLMSVFFVRNHINEYQSLAKDFKIWASTTIYSDNPKNLLDSGQVFDDYWKNIVTEKYLPQLVVWALPISGYSYEKATKIESVIQSNLVKTFDLRGFFNVKNISMLGKVEHPHLKSLSLNISGVPDLDPISELLLMALDNTKISKELRIDAVNQLKAAIKKRDRIKNIKRKDFKIKIATYKNQGLPWSLEDLEKLRVMVTDFNLSPREISLHLHRHPSAITKRIDKNDKLSNSMWRNDLKWL